MSKLSYQWINTDKLKNIMEAKGWSESILAAKLEVDNSYLNRILREKRNGGVKLLLGLLKLCEKEGLDIFEFIEYQTDKKESQLKDNNLE